MKKRILKFLIYVLASGLLLAVYSFVEPYWLDIKKIDIEDKDIPDSFNGKKIVFVSDIHHGPNFSRERVAGIVRKINDLNPDIILLGGDYVERGTQYIRPCFEELKKLNAPLGKYGVMGNHDHWEDEMAVMQGMKDAGISLLDNRAQWIIYGKGRIKVGGVGDLYTDSQYIGPTINNVKKDDFVILLSHNPDYAERIKNNKVDIVLSGHTHGGQITLFGRWAPYIPSFYGQKYRTGIVETAFTKVIISNGVGSTGIPIRFFARPQIGVITLRKE